MTRRFAAAALVLAALGLSATPAAVSARSNVHAPGKRNVVAYCRTHPTVDHPSIHDADGMEDNSFAHDIAGAGADNWRCMDGKVLVCAGGASGSACYKLDPSLKPNKDIIDTCKDRPELDFVAMATTVYSSSTWRCKGGKPQIIKTDKLDKRGFLKATWRPLVDAHGHIRKDIDLPADPR
jgi:hypothetical protein